MTTGQLNKLNTKEATAEFSKCCGSTVWVNKMIDSRPFADRQQLCEIAEKKWLECSEKDWLEAFTHHPKIGDLKSLEKKFSATKEWAGGEQAGVNRAAGATLIKLADGNNDYEKKFGFIFIVCATGKSADEMLALLKTRLSNDRNTELKIAMREQNKITRLRLGKLLL